MARIRVRGCCREDDGVYDRYFWPLGLSTPHWFDNNYGEYRHWQSPVGRLWAFLCYHGLIRTRKVADPLDKVRHG